MRKIWFRQDDICPIIIPTDGVDLTGALVVEIQVMRPDLQEATWIVDNIGPDKVVHLGRCGDLDIPGFYRVAIRAQMSETDNIQIYAGPSEFIIEVRPLE